MTGLIAGFTLAIPSAFAEVLHTDTTGLESGEVMIAVDGGQAPAYYAKPSGPGPFPIILVNEEIFGIHEYIKDVCRRFAKVGYMAVSIEIYARIADLRGMTDVAAIVRDVVSKTPDHQVLRDLDHAVAWAGHHGGDRARLGVVGFCRGGRNTWLYAAHNPALKAAVAWYGPVKGPMSAIQPQTASDVAAAIKCPLLGLYAGKDGTGIEIADVEAAKDRAVRAGKAVEIVVYPEATHGFHADYRPSYDAEAATDGWNRTLNWFRKYGVA